MLLGSSVNGFHGSAATVATSAVRDAAVENFIVKCMALVQLRVVDD
jgi:hypothetical protein